MPEKVARLSDEQWGAFEAALDGEIADLRAQLQQAIKRGEAAEAMAEIRLQRGLAALDILRAVLEAGRTTVAIGGLEWKGWGTARVLTPAEAQRGEGDA